MSKVLESYLYGDPAETLDRKRATEAAQAKRKAERKANQRSGLTEEELKLIPKDWVQHK